MCWRPHFLLKVHNTENCRMCVICKKYVKIRFLLQKEYQPIMPVELATKHFGGWYDSTPEGCSSWKFMVASAAHNESNSFLKWHWKFNLLLILFWWKYGKVRVATRGKTDESTVLPAHCLLVQVFRWPKKDCF